MKLTFVLRVDLRVGRGSINVLFNLLKYKPDNIEVTIISTDDNSGNPLILSQSDVNEFTKNSKIITLHAKIPMIVTKNKLYNIYIFFIARPAKRIVKHIPKEILNEIQNTDVAYLFFNDLATLFYNTNIPVVGSNHMVNLNEFKNNNILYRIYFKLRSKIYYKNINFFHVLSNDKEGIHYLRQYFNLRDIMILPNGIDTSFFYPDYNVNNKRLKFLFVATLAPEKGLDLLLPLIDKLNNSAIEFHIAGGGKLADEIKANKKIIYHGILSNVDLAKLYRECDVFIYPSHGDVFPLVVLQALSSGLYVMCSDYLKGIFEEFENKYLEYLPLDPDIWYKRVNEIVKNRNIIEHNKKEEYEYVKENYDWSKISKQFYDYMIKFYKEIKG